MKLTLWTLEEKKKRHKRNGQLILKRRKWQKRKEKINLLIIHIPLIHFSKAGMH